MGAPQLVLVSLWAVGLGIELVKHGEPRTGNHSVIGQMVAIAINATILYWGGFFN